MLYGYGVVSTRGWDGTVGVPGILLNEGLNYYMDEHGFGCKSI
jgi:hypothetical protein